MPAFQIIASTLVSALGIGKQAHWTAMQSNATGLTKRRFLSTDLTTPPSYLGEVTSCEQTELPSQLQHYDCRNNRLAYLAMLSDDFIDNVSRAIRQYGPTQVGLVVGTSTSGIAATENALRHQTELAYAFTHRMTSLADFCADSLAIQGPRQVISTACSSSVKAFATAQRWLEAGLVRAVVVGGVDSLCATTFYGFSSLELVSEQLCAPLDKDRNGINIGEAGGFMLLEKTSHKEADAVYLTGVGEGTDGYHAATPHPEGVGIRLAMQNALSMANVPIQDIDYLNLHGTGTQANDAAEMYGVNQLFGTCQNPCYVGSTKAFTGHTLGASGIVEAVLCQLAIEHHYIPANLNLSKLDPALPLPANLRVPTTGLEHPVRTCLSNALGFGGSNASLILQSGTLLENVA
jgi:3-oxoacyl-[acyl-carrier-protein] synthase-1